MIRNGATVDNILADIAAEIEKHKTSPPGDEGTPQRDQCKFAIDQHVRTLFPMVVGYVKALVQLDRTLTLLDPQLSFNLSRHLPPAMPISFASPGAFIRSSLPTIGFLGHALLELPAALNFFFNPLAQLLSPEAATETTPLITNPSIGSSALSASAPVVIRQYAVLLFSSILISGLFFARRVDLLSKQVASALSLYHVAASLRAFSRILDGEAPFNSNAGSMGGPAVHLISHTIVTALLVSTWAYPSDGSGRANSKAKAI